MDVRDRLDDVERDLKKRQGVGVGVGVGGAASEDLDALKKDVDYIMGRDGKDSGDIQGTPSLVSLLF